MKKMSKHVEEKSQESGDGQSFNDPSPNVHPIPKEQQSQDIVHDEFICGVCHLSSGNLWAFLLHKIEHSFNGPIPCWLCKTSLRSVKSAKLHYVCFHNVRVENDKIAPVDGHSSISPENVQEIVCKSVELCEKAINKSLKRKRKRKQKPRPSVYGDSKSVSHDNLDIAQPTAINHVISTRSKAKSQSSETFVKRRNLKRDRESGTLESQNGNSKRFKASTSVLRIKDSRAEGSSVMREDSVSNIINVASKSGDRTSDSQKCDLAKRQISLSAAALAKIKKFASIMSARTVSKETQKKIFILCKPDNSGLPLVQTKSIARASAKNQVSSSPVNVVASARPNKSNLEESKVVPPKMPVLSDHSFVDVNNFEKDFLFRLVMKESAGKNFRYMREVYKCMYCDTFEKCCLDLLIAHMRESHKSMVFDKCPLEVVTAAKVKKSADMTSSEVVTFQEYKSKLFEQKNQDEERRLRLQKEKGLPKHLTGLPCKYCPKRLTTATKLQAHMDRHLNVKRFLCEECGRSFGSWDSLRRHKKAHLNASYGKIKCASCSFQSGDANAVNNHYRIHPKNLNLCHICGNMYSSLRKHIKVHSKERPYPCPYTGCTFRFTSEIPCKIHYQAHFEHGRRFSCSKCKSQFSRKCHLLRHLTKVHNDSIDIQETLCSSQISEPIQPSSLGIVTTEDVHEFEQSAESTEMEEFSLAVGQESIRISESFQ